MKKTVSLLLVAMMLLGVSSAMALPTIGSHPSEGDKGGVRAAIITAAISKSGEMLDQAAIDALGLKFTNHGRATSSVTKWKGFQFATAKGVVAFVDVAASVAEYLGTTAPANFAALNTALGLTGAGALTVASTNAQIVAAILASTAVKTYADYRALVQLL